MLKTVAVMDGLEQVVKALREQGVRVVDVANTGGTISAIVYSSRVNPVPAERKWIEARPESGGGSDDMVLMLNADEMSVEEIVARVKAAW